MERQPSFRRSKLRTNRDVEVQLEEKFSEILSDLNILPGGYKCSVRLHAKERDKRRTASFENNWAVETDSINVTFEQAVEQPHAGPQPLRPESTSAPAGHAVPAPNNPLSDLIRALDRAESRPGYEFVALKWFRDTALPSEGFQWVRIETARNGILRDAIEKRLILTSRVPNPKSPQFPVTAIRLNRLMPEVRAILGSPRDGVPDFQPVAIRGEDLSMTVLRDRR
jgi:hypothetical protein